MKPTLSLLAVLLLAPITLFAAEARKAPAAVVASLAQPPVMPAAGAKDADVTIVEFFDYNCPFCKKTAPELVKLLHVDPESPDSLQGMADLRRRLGIRRALRPRRELAGQVSDRSRCPDRSRQRPGQ